MRIIQFTQPEMGRCLGVVREDRVVNVARRHPQLTSMVKALSMARASASGKRLELLHEEILN